MSRGRADTAALALLWFVGRANSAFDVVGGPSVNDLYTSFGAKQAPGQRARTLLTAAGFPDDEHWYVLGSPSYLVGRHRRAVMRQRDTFTQWTEPPGR